jgi:hypothetical protein
MIASVAPCVGPFVSRLCRVPATHRPSPPEADRRGDAAVRPYGPAPDRPAHGRCSLATPSAVRHVARVLPVRVLGSYRHEGTLTRTHGGQVHDRDDRTSGATLRYTLKRDDAGHPVIVGRTLTTPHDSAAILAPLLQHAPSEVFAILCLSTKRRVIAYHEVSRAHWTRPSGIPAECSSPAILANAAAVIVADVRPSGDPTPSPDGLHLTRQLVAAGTLLPSRCSTTSSSVMADT